MVCAAQRETGINYIKIFNIFLAPDSTTVINFSLINNVYSKVLNHVEYNNGKFGSIRDFENRAARRTLSTELE